MVDQVESSPITWLVQLATSDDDSGQEIGNPE